MEEDEQMITEKKTQFLVDELDELKKNGQFRPLRVLGSAQDTEVVVDGKRVLNLSSDNLLGLTTHSRLKSAMVSATEEWGAGSGAVRTIAGTMTVHEELERWLAEFKPTEASLVFQSGFTANLGVLQSLVKEGDVIISDELNHASIIDGIRLSKAERSIFKHRDLDDLERQLEKHREKRVKLVVTAGVFSMDGDIAPLAGIVDRPGRFGAMIMVDDAHATSGLANTARFKAGLKRLGFETGASETPITPVIVGKGSVAMELSDRLFGLGVFAQGIGYPTVPEGRARIRTIVTSVHTDQQLDRALEAFEKGGKELGVIA